MLYVLVHRTLEILYIYTGIYIHNTYCTHIHVCTHMCIHTRARTHHTLSVEKKMWRREFSLSVYDLTRGEPFWGKEARRLDYILLLSLLLFW